MKFFNRSVAIICVAFALDAFGCKFTSDTNKTISQSNTALQGNATSDTPSGGTTPGDKPHYLEAKWYEDANGDGVPNFIETELGKDPNEKDHCPVQASKCGGGANGEDLDFSVNTLLMLDASGSMNSKIGGASKLDIAKESLLNYAAHAPKPVKMGFLVYGHKGNNTPSGKAESCSETGVELLDPIGNVAPDTFPATLARFQPTGWTPIAGALKKAQESFAGTEGKKNHIVMVSDGLETCGGDPVAVARRLHEQGFHVVIDIIGFGAGRNDVAQLRKIAEAGGGDYYDAKTRADLDNYFKQMDEAYLKTIGNSNCFIEAYNDANLCDAAYVNDAVGKINRELGAAFDESLKTQNQDKYMELTGFQPRIRELQNQRRAAREASYARSKELSDKAHEINRQTLDSYEKVR